MSQAFKNRNMPEFCKIPLNVSAPVEENTPNWESYRLSFNRMQRLSQETTHVRLTTGFSVYGIDFRDYLRAKQSSLDILSREYFDDCSLLEYINVRGHSGRDITALVHQKSNLIMYVYSKYSFGCQFDARVGSIDSAEHSFGCYCTYEKLADANRNFRGTEKDSSTTEYWFGSYL